MTLAISLLAILSIIVFLAYTTVGKEPTIEDTPKDCELSKIADSCGVNSDRTELIDNEDL